MGGYEWPILQTQGSIDSVSKVPTSLLCEYLLVSIAIFLATDLWNLDSLEEILQLFANHPTFWYNGHSNRFPFTIKSLLV